MKRRTIAAAAEGGLLKKQQQPLSFNLCLLINLISCVVLKKV